MKALHFIAAALLISSLASCNTSDFESDETTVNTLVNTFGATNIFAEPSQPDNLDLKELPSMTASEAYTILGDIRKHQGSKKNTRAFEEQASNKVLFSVEMSETISGRHTFSLQLNLMKYADGSLFYSGYEAECVSDSFKWYRKGFSFSCDNSRPGCYKFENQGSLYFKVLDGSVQYLKVPFKVIGTYNPATQEVNFTYNL